ncbi:MAG: glycoside hydrolase family 127 protein [Bryobacteraceae bacterium]|nr:glycoside hydrolase family 127 protein [Bryobacteraceae bacterium]
MITRRTLLGSAAAAAVSPGQGSVERRGQLSLRYDLTLRRVREGGPPLYSKELVLADTVPRPVRRFTEFSGDVSGRWLEALAAASADRKERYPELAAWLPELLAAQREEGYFGAGFARQELRREDMALLWGNGRLLAGLVEAHRLTGDPRALAAARRLGDFLLKIAPEMNSPRVRQQFAEGAFAMGYICWTQMTEPLSLLARVTREAAYARLGREIAARIERRPAEHAHGFLTSLRGAVDLYESTGDRALLELAEKEWRAVVDSGNVLVAGTIPEAWKPRAVRTEGCAEADWLRLSLQLWRTTGKAQYLEAAERTLFNEFAMNQFSTGDFGHRALALNGVRAGATDPQGGASARAWWCCTLHGLRAFPEIFRHAWREADGGLWHDLPVEGEGQMKGFRVAASSSLEVDGTITVRILEAPGRRIPLHFRNPSWADGSGIHSHSGAAEITPMEGWHRVARIWQPGDLLTVRYSMKTRAERDTQGRVALFHGPWLLGVAEATDPFFFDEPFSTNRLRVTVGSDGSVRLMPAGRGSDHAFAAPGARFEVQYLPGGYPLQPGTATLRPVSEQTGLRTCDWEYWFLTAD